MLSKIKIFFNSNGFKQFLKFILELIAVVCKLLIIIGVTINAVYYGIHLANNVPCDIEVLNIFKNVLYQS